MRRLWGRDEGAVLDAVERRDEEARARLGQPRQQVAAGVGRADLLGDQTVDRPGVQAFLELERAGAGDLVPGQDGVLDGGGSKPFFLSVTGLLGGCGAAVRAP